MPTCARVAGARLHVVAAVMQRDHKVLLSLRHRHLDQGGLWEFPGGKVEERESFYSALRRELREELGIEIEFAKAFMQVPYAYPEYQVCLDVWQVQQWRNEPRGMEGQTIEWVAERDLHTRAFPAANLPIVTALQSVARRDRC